MLSKAARALTWRVRFLLDDNPFALRERLAYVNPWKGELGLHELVSRSARDRDGDDPWFALGGWRIHALPDEPVDRGPYLRAVELVLRESFLRDELTCPEVEVRPGDTVLDLGGHIGVSAMLFARRCGAKGKVFSFEPVTPEVIQRNLTANRIANAAVVPMGVADRCGDAPLELTDESIDASIARSPGDGGQEVRLRTVPVTTLDAWVDANGLASVDFIKMDIEGAEELALRGAKNTIERFRPRWSIASYHTDHVGEKQHPKLTSLMRDFGYRVREVGRTRVFAW